MPTATAQSTDRLMAVLESAFLPLEARAETIENGNVQLRILDGSEAIHIDERPLFGSHAEQLAQSWISETRRRLEEMGYQLDAWQSPSKEERSENL